METRKPSVDTLDSIMTKALHNLSHIALLVLLFNHCNSTADTSAPELMLFDFNAGLEGELIEVEDARFKIRNDDLGKCLEVNTGTALTKPGVRIKKPGKEEWDLSGYHQVKADVKNIGDEAMQVEMFVGNDPDGLVRWYCSDYLDLKPGESGTITVHLTWTPWVHEPQLDFIAMRGAPGQIKTDVSKIDEFAFYSRYAKTRNSFLIDNIRAVGKLEVRDTADFYPFIDQFGQYKHEGWKGKVAAVADLKRATDKEKADLKKHPAPDGLSTFGGWADGPKFEATGFFRTEKYKGKWWMVDPEGYLFWSAGMNCVHANSVQTGIEGREHYFESLPPNEGSTAQFHSLSNWAPMGYYARNKPYKAFNFYQHNLYLKYGDNWLSIFQDKVHQRFKSWGLNTIGFVSDFEATRQGKTPYVGSIWINATPKIAGSEGYWGEFHDVFDPDFRKRVAESVVSQKEGANDPWCIGYFVDNELSWGDVGSLAEGVLRSPASQPAKLEFVNDLKNEYKTIDALNKAWGSNFSTWEERLNSTQVPHTSRAKKDLQAFYRKIAETYFETIHTELKKVAPNQNYLGCRFAWANNAIVLGAASAYMDIMSFNKYEYSVENVSLPQGIDKPILIGEFHFGALDRGMFHVGVKQAKDQAERGQLYQDYIRGALRNPNIIGAHWFQYIDQPATGRGDGENYNVGWVDVCDNPFEEVIEKVRETTYGLYPYRLNDGQTGAIEAALVDFSN
ncbi:MAG: beta-galactosidase [Bacteroidota bacterium]